MKRKLLLWLALITLAFPLHAQSHSVTLAWTVSITSGVTSQNVKRSATTGGPYTAIASLAATATTYTDTTVVDGSTYYYVVTAVNSASVPPESGPSNEVKAVVPFPTPAPPTGLTITNITASNIQMQWQPPVLAVGETLNSYTVDRKPVSATQNWWGAYAHGLTATNLLDSNVTPGVPYQYKVAASVKENGANMFTPFSNVVAAVP